ncbi:MAG TPA: nuclear transport factor 2 family protein [Ignavibacteriales bacterium]|nr:nuclear transport factor 2 family protein [Ignavibacteriales bacterium]
MRIQRYLLVFVSVLCLSLAVKAAQPGEDEVRQAVSSFVKATDTRNVSNLQELLAPKASFSTLNKINNSFTQVAAEDYINSVKAGKIGGWERNLTINSVDINDNLAMAKLELTDARLKQVEFVTLMKVNGSWKIVNSALTTEKK